MPAYVTISNGPTCDRLIVALENATDEDPLPVVEFSGSVRVAKGGGLTCLEGVAFAVFVNDIEHGVLRDGKTFTLTAFVSIDGLPGVQEVRFSYDAYNRRGFLQV